MRGDHGRYEELAVGHVLGGLDASAAADFRSHLLECRACRSRVHELRELAADLAAAERDERARTRVRTEVVRRDEGEPEAPPTSRIGARHLGAAALVVIVLVAALAFWNLHLRTAGASYQQVATYRGETLRELATGVAIPAATAEGVGSLVVVDGEQVAFSLVDLPPLTEGERVEIWLLEEEAEAEAVAVRGLAPVPAGRVADGSLAGHLDVGSATALVVTRERGPLRDTPGGTELLRAELQATG